MRRLPHFGLALALALGLAPVGLPRAQAQAAQEKKVAAEEKVRFETADHVELKGTFYPSERGKKAPSVILLHKTGGNSQEEGWDSLAVELQKKGFAVLAFDFRGHGNSTTIKNPIRFWGDPTNRQMVRGFVPSARQLKDTINYKDFINPAYYMTLVNDIAAAKLFLDVRKNDDGACDSAATILLGAEDGATLGALWMTSEFYRYRVIPSGLPNVQSKVDPTPEGKDLVCAVWLSMTSSIHRTPVPAHEWVKFVGRQKKVPMAFFYGDKDSRAETFAKNAIRDIKPDKNAYTSERAVKGTNLAGSKLLNSSLEAQTDIVKYLDGFIEDRGIADWDKKDARKNSYVWIRPNVPGASIPAKAAEEETLNVIPVTQLGLLR
jgi:pimeloyl-ACP methyl ester carboxylesterase